MKSSELKQVSFFSELSELKLEKLLVKFCQKQFLKNQVIFQEGDPGNELFIVTEGKVKIFRLYPDGREITLAVLKPFNYFGEFSLLDRLPRSAGAVAVENTILHVLEKHSFDEFLKENSQASLEILKAMSIMIRKTNDRIESLSFRDSKGRLASKLLEMSKNGTHSVSATHQELSEMIGTARETVTRSLNFFEKNNILKLERAGISILLPSELEKYL
jgi:CRP/FNR family transcriptional regulator